MRVAPLDIRLTLRHHLYCCDSQVAHTNLFSNLKLLLVFIARWQTVCSVWRPSSEMIQNGSHLTNFDHAAVWPKNGSERHPNHTCGQLGRPCPKIIRKCDLYLLFDRLVSRSPHCFNMPSESLIFGRLDQKSNICPLGCSSRHK